MLPCFTCRACRSGPALRSPLPPATVRSISPDGILTISAASTRGRRPRNPDAQPFEAVNAQIRPLIPENRMQVDLQTIETNGIQLRVALAGQGPLVVLIHGFPEGWYSWRHQIAALAATGSLHLTCAAMAAATSRMPSTPTRSGRSVLTSTG